MYEGSKEAMVSKHTSGTAILTNPAPPLSAAIPASAAAPLIPREEPTISAVPKSPLCASAFRGGSFGRGSFVEFDMAT
jgi:hypothetical protein